MKKIRLEGLDREEYELRGIEGLMNIWRANHNALLNYLKSVEVPYFGLHGTSTKNLKSILDEKSGTFEMGTFYDKKIDEKRLFQLYSLCKYVSIYATRDDDKSGEIMVFNLEKDDKNFTLEWEKLNTPISLSFLLKSDTNKESKNFTAFENPENMLWRTGCRFVNNIQNDTYPPSFPKCYKGSVSMKNIIEKYSLLFSGPQRLDKMIMGYRLQCQEILSKTFNILQEREK